MADKIKEFFDKLTKDIEVTDKRSLREWYDVYTKPYKYQKGFFANLFNKLGMQAEKIVKNIICPNCLKSIVIADIDFICPTCEEDYPAGKNNKSRLNSLFYECDKCKGEMKYLTCNFCGHKTDLFAIYNYEDLVERRRNG